MIKSRFKILCGLFLACILVLGIVPGNAMIYEGQDNSKPVLMTGRLQVQFETDVTANKLSTSFGRVSFGIASLDQTLEKIDAREAMQMFPWRKGKDAVVGDVDMSKFYELIFSEDLDMNQVMDELVQNPYVRSVTPIYAMPVAGIQPDDPEFYRQWGIKKINDTTAWLYEKGSDTAKVAIVDTGVDYDHVDLMNNIWVNPGEDNDHDMVVYDNSPADSNYVDDDLNGRVDDLIGYDFFSGFSGLTCWPGEDCNIPDNNPDDFNGHGTHCAGIAAAISNNTYGVAGVAGGWGGGLGPYAGVRIMCLRAGGSAVDPDYGYEAGYINTANAAQAIDYAAMMGADAISCSFGFPSYSDPAFTAALQRPLELGADIVLLSISKFMSGNATILGGALVGPEALIEDIRWNTTEFVGSIVPPMEAWLTLQYLETLAMRMQRHSDNALAVAGYLNGHPKVEHVNYSGLEDHPQHALACGQMSGHGGLLSFVAPGGRSGAAAVMNRFKLVVHAVTFGTSRSICMHPPTITHEHMTSEERQAAGIDDGLIRFSVGLENPEDIIADLDQALT